jgi:septal ring factor EnvC (AmiA/AmiB activator)
MSPITGIKNSRGVSWWRGPAVTGLGAMLGLLFLLMTPRLVPADEPDPGSAVEPAPVGVPADRADELQREIEASSDQVAAFSREAATVVKRLDETERSLDQARKEAARLAAKLHVVALRIRELEDRYQDVEKRAERNANYVAGRLAALYQLSWFGKFQLMASAESVFDFITLKRALERILAQDEALIDQFAADKAEMLSLLARLGTQKDAQHAAAANLNRRMAAMRAQQARREALLAKIRSQKSLQLAAIESLRSAARELDRSVAALKSDPPPAAGPTEKSFGALKGLLMMPVEGKIVSFFGNYRDRRLKVTHIQSGINIQADRGEPIRAVFGGRTLYASWFKGFGNMLIIDHGDHYYTVYAHLEEQFKSEGDPVETGEVIATVGDTGAMAGPGLHFEIRHHGKPMNPMDWIKQG